MAGTAAADAQTMGRACVLGSRPGDLHHPHPGARGGPAPDVARVGRPLDRLPHRDRAGDPRGAAGGPDEVGELACTACRGVSRPPWAGSPSGVPAQGDQRCRRPVLRRSPCRPWRGIPERICGRRPHSAGSDLAESARIRRRRHHKHLRRRRKVLAQSGCPGSSTVRTTRTRPRSPAGFRCNACVWPGPTPGDRPSCSARTPLRTPGRPGCKTGTSCP